MCSPEHKYFLSVLLSQRARRGDGGFFPAAHALASASRSIYWSHSAPWPKADEEGGKTKSNEREKGGFCAARVCGSQPEPPLGRRCPLWGSGSCFAALQLLQVVVLWGVGWGDMGHEVRSRLLWGQQVLLCDCSVPRSHPRRPGRRRGTGLHWAGACSLALPSIVPLLLVLLPEGCWVSVAAFGFPLVQAS